MRKIKISRDLLEQLFDFADNIQGHVPDWVMDKYDVEAEWLFPSRMINELLEGREDVDLDLQS